MKQKGQVLMSLVVAGVALCVIIILYIVFNRFIFGGANGLYQMGSGITDSNFIMVSGLFNVVWTNWPIIMLLGFMVLIFIVGQKRTTE